MNSGRWGNPTEKRGPHLVVAFFKNTLTEGVYLSMRERQREGNIYVREEHPSVASCTQLVWGLDPRPRYLRGPGIKPTSSWGAGRCSNQLSHISQGCHGILMLKMRKKQARRATESGQSSIIHDSRQVETTRTALADEGYTPWDVSTPRTVIQPTEPCYHMGGP